MEDSARRATVPAEDRCVSGRTSTTRQGRDFMASHRVLLMILAIGGLALAIAVG